MKIHKKIARRYIQSREHSINPILQENTAEARISLDQLEGLIERGVELINDSSEKEHIYAEAGDMISNITGLVEKLKENILALSYLASRKNHKNIKNRLPAEVREEIDSVVKHSSIAENVAEKYRNSSSFMPGGGSPEFFHKDESSISLKTDQRTDENQYDTDVNEGEEGEQKEVEEMVHDKEKENLFYNQNDHRQVTDWTDHGTGFNVPDHIPDEIRFH